MSRSTLLNTAGAHTGHSQTAPTVPASPTNERLSLLTPNLSHLMNRSEASSRASILPPLTHPKPRAPQQPFIEGAKAFRLSSHEMQRPAVYRHTSGAGAEPGVNPRQGAQYTQLRRDCLIDIIDYDADDVSIERLGNADFIRMMKEETENNPDGGHPRAVRWINIAGIDWEVLSCLALNYHIHSLALEDILHDRGDIQSKVDYYADHMFIRVLCHSVCQPDDQRHLDLSIPENRYRYGAKRRHYRGDNEPPAYKATDAENLESGHLQADSRTLPLGAPSTMHQGHSSIGSILSRLPYFGFPKWRGSHPQAQAIKHGFLTAGDRPNIRHDPMCILLFRDGTIISIMPTSNLDFTAPITERLYNNQSILRISEEASLLMESLLDLVVDRILEVVDQYQVKIHDLEHNIILNPNMDTIRSLHVLSGDLIANKLTLQPIKTMINNLPEYDRSKCSAIAEHIQADVETTDSYDSDFDSDSGASIPLEGGGKDASNKSGKKKSTEESINTGQKMEHAPAVQRPDAESVDGTQAGQQMSGKKKRKIQRPSHKKSKKSREARKAERSRWKTTWRSNPDGSARGYLTYTCKLYLADVSDHMDFAMTSLDMFAGASENLINYAFNVASYETNRVMSRLTIVTIIFLPPSLLTGYFGMSFQPFWGLDGHSVALFWEIVLPVMAVLVPLFMFHEVRNWVTNLGTNRKVRKAVQS